MTLGDLIEFVQTTDTNELTAMAKAADECDLALSAYWLAQWLSAVTSEQMDRLGAVPENMEFHGEERLT